MVNGQVKASVQRRKKMLFLYIGFLLLWSLSVALMPVASAIKEDTMLLIFLCGATFWTGAAGTICMALRINYCRKRCYPFNMRFPHLKQLGLIHFFRNRAAVFADVVMFVSIIGYILVKLYWDELFILFMCLAIFIFSFGMHCLLNGINYKYINFKR